ncbi:hypothetical protein BJ741DRAFT_595255 [Chytriomyces cf. hyalinus JEL632]|nr:hypothetical protein BJ741DRAFT_595255 [Chytriomyces cf. hyalinus JEL632]
MSHSHMALHFGISDIVILQNAVPQNGWQYLGALVFLVALPVLQGLVGSLERRAKPQQRWQPPTKQSIEERTLPGDTLREAPPAVKMSTDSRELLVSHGLRNRDAPGAENHEMTQLDGVNLAALKQDIKSGRKKQQLGSKLARLKMVQFVTVLLRVGISLFVMLAMMQFNVGYLLAASLGHGLSALLFEDTDAERLCALV